MPVCEFSKDYDAKNYTLIENRFITDYLPVLLKEYNGQDAISVYLFGLYLCTNEFSELNNLDGISKGTGLNGNSVKKAFDLLQKYGLIIVETTTPLHIKFNSPNKALPAARTYNPDKYTDFILDMNQLFIERDFTKNDAFAFIDFLEESKMEIDAFTLIAKYCLDLKGKKASRNYILAVARNWASEGCLTFDSAESRLQLAQATTGEIKQILKALKSTRAVDIDDRDLYLKWTKMGFELDSIVLVAKQVKRGGMDALDELLDKYAQEGVFTPEDVKAYTKHKAEVNDCTVKVLQKLGDFYKDFSVIAEEYIATWFKKGYSSEGLQKIATYCRICSIRDIQGFDKTVQNFYQGGYVTDHNVSLQLDALARFDEKVQNVVYATGSTRRLTADDRDKYRMWSVLWGISDDVIMKYALQSQGKAFAMAWISARLSELKGTDAFVASQQAPENTQSTPQPHKLSDFERAEIKEKLLEDGLLAKLVMQKKKLDFEMAGYLFNGTQPPIIMQEQLNSLQQEINDRIIELGYNPQDLK